jgi:cytochrome c-type biogenesis protein CcsB
MTFGFFCLSALCFIRWISSEHLPFSNLYESSLFLAWNILFFYLIFKRKIGNDWLDAIIAPILLITTTFSNLGLPKEFQQATVLVPALQSNWLMMHVSMMILSYGALLLGSLLSMTFLSINFFPIIQSDISSLFPKLDFFVYWNFSSNPFNNENLSKNKNLYQQFRIQKNFDLQSLKKKQKNEEEKKITMNPDREVNFLDFFTFIFFQKYKSLLINQIDYWSYRIIGIGFPFLTLGILSGAVWANEAWGSYWSWDPKETWALITWVIFAIYLHTRITKGWSGTKPALVASFGFFVLWMCYLGVNLLGKGLHSYGWLN